MTKRNDGMDEMRQHFQGFGKFVFGVVVFAVVVFFAVNGLPRF